MATREEVLLAKAVIDRVNDVITQLHSSATRGTKEIELIEGMINDTVIKEKIIAGLGTYEVDVVVLKTELNTCKDIVAYIKNNKPPVVQN